ncbi:hypothetical protein LEP1GSC035_2323 [Leptospira noguchii str. 2007001578]|uniref:Uncharacterized protein n=1 Tax=Leptospira noguchii str. 2007001578 TaxID=1049974 RepID=A0ABP2T8P2_9LEPT|nr:hypothetical protein LEP1GSC035_2323 [Leptospira noguchii str. 2007001578]
MVFKEKGAVSKNKVKWSVFRPLTLYLSLTVFGEVRLILSRVVQTKIYWIKNGN